MNNQANTSQKRHTLRTPSDLIQAGLAPESSRENLEFINQHYATAIPPDFQKIIQNLDDPIAKQVIPNIQELETKTYETIDPIGDDAFSPVKGIVHRYEDRALLKPLLICPLYCRFCFRREHVGPDGGLLNEAELDQAFDWIKSHPEIREIILTGGDPLMLAPRRMKHIIQTLSHIPHIETIRIHTRVPVADPNRISSELLDALETERSMWVVTHINHARELTEDARQSIKNILSRAIPVLSQSVLLRGINDTPEALENLLRALVKARVKPYYLHHLDAAPGTSHFHVPVEEGKALLANIRGRVTGLAWPTYVVDIPGGKGKVPLGPDYLLPEESGTNRKIKSPKGDIFEFI